MDWEDVFTQWAQPPGKTETERCERTVGAIKKAVANSSKLNQRSILVFSQGSYRNRVNVRKDSDVDVGVMFHDAFLYQYPIGKSGDEFGNLDFDYSYFQFKNELEEALVVHFGRDAVKRGNKAFDIKAKASHVEADVVPLFEYRHYEESGAYRCGVGLIPDTGNRIINFPERLLESWPTNNQHYENGVAKNGETSRGFKGVVRILKCLKNFMDDKGIAAARPIPSYLVECLIWNVPNKYFENTTWDASVQRILRYLWQNTKEDVLCAAWCEVDDIKYLFTSSQPWARADAHEFIDAAWDFVGIR